MLTRITVPAGGWAFQVKLSDAAPFDTTINATLAAGDYYVCGDNQDDDLLYELSSKATASIVAAGAPFNAANCSMVAWIDEATHKVKLGFESAVFQGATRRQVKIMWTATNADLVEALGFDDSADDVSTGSDNPTFTADWHHAWGWYADRDGMLRAAPPSDYVRAMTQHGMGYSGVQKAQLFGEQFFTEVELYGITRAKTWSAGRAYGAAPVYPYSRNEGLECWWRSACGGTPFRLYLDGRVSSTIGADAGSAMTAHNTTTMTIGSRSWSIDGQRWAGRILYRPTFGSQLTYPASFYIASNTATVVTVENAHPSGFNLGDNGQVWVILDQPYETYQLDFERGAEWKPSEIPALDEYIVSLNLARYVEP